MKLLKRPPLTQKMKVKASTEATRDATAAEDRYGKLWKTTQEIARTIPNTEEEKAKVYSY